MSGNGDLSKGQCPQTAPGRELIEEYFTGPFKDDARAREVPPFVQHAGGCRSCGPVIEGFKDLHPDSPLFKKK